MALYVVGTLIVWFIYSIVLGVRYGELEAPVAAAALVAAALWPITFPLVLVCVAMSWAITWLLERVV